MDELTRRVLANDHAFMGLGLATALIHRAVADCRARGAGPVLICADVDDTPKRMYAAMGFRPIAVEQKYLLEMPARVTSVSRAAPS